MAELTPEQIRLEQERLALIQEQSAAAKELASTYEKMAKSKTKLTAEEKEILGLTKQLNTFASQIENTAQKRISGTATSKDLTKSIKELEADIAKNQALYRDIAIKINAEKQKALTNFTSLGRQEIAQQKSLKDQLIEQDKILDEIDRLKRAGASINVIKNERDKLTLLKQSIKDTEEELQKTIKKKDAQKDLYKQLKASQEAHEKITAEQQKELDLAKKALEQKKKEEALDVVRKGLRLDEIKEMFTLAGLFKMILDAGLRFNKISVETGKNLGYGADQANRVTQNLTEIANSSNNLNVTLKSLGEAMGDLNTATGGVAEYSADTLETQVMLTKQLGLSGEEAAGIYKFSALTGKASSQINDEMVGAFVSTRNMVKGSANFKTTMAEVAKTSGQLAINFKNNPAEITKAVVQAQALGTTLEQAKEQGKKLLEFESSIESELKAELLTGQQMNLERARAAALQGDQVTVMKELANQNMTLEKFQNMNVIAQESFAEALGLSADQLSDQLRKQKIAQEQGKSLAQITKEEALEAEKRQAIQDKFNAAIEKLQDFFGNLVAGPVGQFLELLTSSLNLITSIGAGLATWYVTSKLIAGSQMLIAWYSKQKLIADKANIGVGRQVIVQLGTMLGLSSAKAVAETTAATALSFGALLPIILGAGVAIYSLISSFKGPAFAKGGIVTGEINNATVGEAGPEAIIPLNSPKADKMLGNGANIDLTPMINAINQVKASVDRLYAKDTSINMDGKQVGSTLVQGSYKSA